MMKNRNLAIVACAGLCASAWAQIGTGTWTWEVSADGGATWATGLVEVPPEQQEVRVRAVAAWTSDAGGWFGLARVDALWASIDNAGLADSVTSIERYRPFTFSAQTLVATRFGHVIKIDDIRDTLPPGEGDRTILPGQGIPQWGGSTTANPAALFEFRIALDGSPGDRLASGAFRPPNSNGNSIDRIFTVYADNNGLTNLPLVTVSNATVRVVPSPGGAAFAIGAALWAARRRRE